MAGSPRRFSPAHRRARSPAVQNAENIAPRDPFVDLSERGVRAAVKRTAKVAAEETGNQDFERVSTHDLRRRFAQWLLVDEEINPAW